MKKRSKSALSELIGKAIHQHAKKGIKMPLEEYVAECLMARGVIVPPCSIGDTVFYITGIHNTLVKEAKVEEIYFNDDGFAFRVCSGYVYFDIQEDDVFYSRESAEQSIESRERMGIRDDKF